MSKLNRALKSTTVGIVMGAMLLFGAVAPATAAETTTTASASSSTSTTEKAVAKILADTNAARKSKGLKPLKLSTSITKVAASWSKAQHNAGTMSHNPRYASQIPSGWTAAAENVAYGYGYTAVTKAWLNSPGHRANILNAKYTHIGIGYYSGPRGTYYTQVFGAYPVTAKAPSAPTGVKATVASTTGKATWTAAKANGAKIKRYVLVLHNTETDGTRKVSTTKTALALSSLKRGTTYTVLVRAQNSAGWSAKSTTLTVTTKK